MMAMSIFVILIRISNFIEATSMKMDFLPLGDVRTGKAMFFDPLESS